MQLRHTGTVRIETERLILDRFNISDAKDMYDTWSGDEEISYCLPFSAHKSVDEAISVVAMWKSAYESEPSFYHFAVREADSRKLIGSVTAKIVSERNRSCELGFSIGRGYRGNGYASEAACALIDYMFFDVGINRIEGFCAANNVPSRAVLENCGLLYEGLCRQKYFLGAGFPIDCHHYALVKDDYSIQYSPIITDFFDLSQADFSLGSNFLNLAKLERQNYYAPTYHFDIRSVHSDIPIGQISLRLGFSDDLYYGGHIGYTVFPQFRNNNAATNAVKILLPLARAHGFRRLIISNELSNIPSAKVCRKAGFTKVRSVSIPQIHELYLVGQRHLNIFKISLS